MLYPEPAFISPGGGELILIMLVLILLFGAKDAPRILRGIQTFLDKAQRTAAEFRYKLLYGDLQNPFQSNSSDDSDYVDDEAPCPEDDASTETEKESPEPEKEN
jgi:Sec-independent protein translocase protein TatA